jgi:hypothetical protein
MEINTLLKLTPPANAVFLHYDIKASTEDNQMAIFVLHFK